MIRAKEAREIADNIHKNKIEETIKYIAEVIEKAAKEGAYAVELNLILQDEVIKRLESIGYKVSKQISGYNETSTYISWLT